LPASAHRGRLDIKFKVHDASLKRALLAAGNFLVEEKAGVSAMVEHIRWEGEPSTGYGARDTGYGARRENDFAGLRDGVAGEQSSVLSCRFPVSVTTDH
jgi:hypothetical protein